MIPGMMPPMRIRPIGSSVRMPYSTSTALGGISAPSVPPTAVVAAARPSSYR